jgi:hypothetical protein
MFADFTLRCDALLDEPSGMSRRAPVRLSVDGILDP